MKLLKSRSGKLSTKSINTILLVIVLIVVVFQVYAELIPEAQTAGSSMNDSSRCVDAGYWYNASSDDCQWNSTFVGNATLLVGDDNRIPLSGLFTGVGGVVFVIIMAAMLVTVVKSVMGKGK